MKYLVSQYGAGIMVGLLEQEGATEDMNLAHNLFNRNSDESIFHGAISFRSVRQFMKFLILKERLHVWGVTFKHGFKAKNNTINKMARYKVRKTLDNNVQFDNFMRNMSYNNSYHNMGTYQDEQEDS